MSEGTARDHRYRILIAVGNPEQYAILLAVAAPLARCRSGSVLPVCVEQGEEMPVWLTVPEEAQDVVEPPLCLLGGDVSTLILDFIDDQEEHPFDLMLLLWRGPVSRGRYLLGRTLDPLIQNAPCAVGVVHADETPTAFRERMGGLQRILVPTAGGPNAPAALDLAADLGEDVEVTALRIAHRHLGPTAVRAQWEILRATLDRVTESDQIVPRVELAASVTEGILEHVAQGYDLMLIGATGESLVDRLLFGNLPQQLALRSPVPVIIYRRKESAATTAWRRARWRILHLMPQLTEDERVAVYRRVRRNARVNWDFAVLMVLGGAIASLGLLLNNTAIVIGATAMTPDMAPLLGTALSVVQGDRWMLRIALRSMATGVLLVLGVSLLLGLLVPREGLTAVMEGNIAPNLLDLGVALAAGAAAGYVTSRGNTLANTLTGLAISVALVPPLCTATLALGAGAPRAALGALLLFLTNLVAIVATAAGLFVWTGFHPAPVRRERITFRGGVLGTVALLVLITGILGVLTADLLRVNALNRAVNRALAAENIALGTELNITDWRVEVGDEGTLHVFVTLLAGREFGAEEAEGLRERLADELGRPVALSLSVVPTFELPAAGP
jgi:uncharacterized hydrophobic protein (TIGR00271 family)